jgi:hypothetical protein
MGAFREDSPYFIQDNSLIINSAGAISPFFRKTFFYNYILSPKILFKKNRANAPRALSINNICLFLMQKCSQNTPKNQEMLPNLNQKNKNQKF